MVMAVSRRVRPSVHLMLEGSTLTGAAALLVC